jgi:integrase
MARKSFSGSHVELRHNTYFAILYIPKDVRSILGKVKFYKSTETRDLILAEKRAAAYVLGWKQQINDARFKTEDPILKSALDLLHQGKESGKRELVADIIDEEEDNIRLKHGDVAADVFKSVSTGRPILESFADGWKQHQIKKRLATKTIDQMGSDLILLFNAFPTSDYLKYDLVNNWILDLADKAELGASSVNRILGSCRNLYVYLKFINEIPKASIDPFVVPDRFKKSKNAKAINTIKSWKPFTQNEVVDLFNLAIKNNDIDLSNLILIGAYTGARIEEICSLKVSDININEYCFTVVDAKTEAGNRIVPIHSQIKSKIEDLIKNSKDGYLLSGLTLNKYGDRSNAIGKRFGRMKTKCGYSSFYVFHSIRKTLITTLENVGVSENCTADIVGHEKPRITYGLYSGGTSLQNKRDAIELVSYPFLMLQRIERSIDIM